MTSNASGVPVAFAAQTVAVAFWLGVVAGAVAVCSAIAFAHLAFGLLLILPAQDTDSRLSGRHETGQLACSNQEMRACYGSRWPAGLSGPK